MVKVMPATIPLVFGLLAAERAAVIRLRDQGRIDDEVLHQVERELDLEEQQIQADL